VMPHEKISQKPLIPPFAVIKKEIRENAKETKIPEDVDAFLANLEQLYKTKQNNRYILEILSVRIKQLNILITNVQEALVLLKCVVGTKVVENCVPVLEMSAEQFKTSTLTLKSTVKKLDDALEIFKHEHELLSEYYDKTTDSGKRFS